jgi:hypothetical protein
MVKRQEFNSTGRGLQVVCLQQIKDQHGIKPFKLQKCGKLHGRKVT